jgi:hypothetical protein
VGEREAEHGVIRPAPIAERLAPVPDPLETYARVSHLPHPIFLDSAERGLRGRYSFVSADPVSVIRSRADAGALGLALKEMGGADATPLPGLPPFRAAPPAASPTSGVPPSSACHRWRLTTSACPTCCSAFMTG